MKVRSLILSSSIASGIAAMLGLAVCAWSHQVGAAGVPGRVGAGIVSELVIDPLTPATLYTVTECGGVVKSTDGGGTWRTANAGLSLGDIRALAVDPATPGLVYLGSGDRGGASKSTDGGNTWKSLVSGDVMIGAQLFVIDPTAPSTLYAATYGGGVLKSTDGGSAWYYADVGLPRGSVSALAIDPRSPNKLYAVVDGWGVYKTTDGGASWQLAPIPPPIGPSPTPAPNTGLPALGLLAVDPTTSGTLYAGTVTFDISAGMVKSTDGANSWHAVTGLDYGPVYAIAVDPITPGTLYVSTGSGGGVFKSINGGSSWQAVNNGLPLRVLVDRLAVDPKTPGTLYAGLSYTSYVDGQMPFGGVFKSTDGGSSWSATGLTGDPICGDGAQCRSEECDDGNLIDGDGCDSNCTATRCGNGIVSAGEECDDGNSDPFDGCTNACTLCGNGVVTPPEECDDGNRSNNDGCTNACLRNVCGDAFVNPATEECDDGNRSNTDACLNDCHANVCGDGFVNPAAEQCDDGNTSNADACRNDCQANVCGDGFLNPATEQCDDGNLVDGDGCDSNCTLTACGNGIVTAGEECDDGNTNPYDGCTNHCTICGNGVVTPPEECDDGNSDPFDGCTTACTLCGNGHVTPPEHCDDGNLVNGDGCDADCIGPVCGNGRLDGDEECDDGGICVGGPSAGARCISQQCPGGECRTVGGDGCAANCTKETSGRVFNLISGQNPDGSLAPGSSGVVLQTTEYGTIPLRLSGWLSLTTGKPRASTGSNDVPVVIRAADFRVDPISIPYRGDCLCLRASASPALGPGNAGAGTIACGAAGGDGVDSVQQVDHNLYDPTCTHGTLEGTCVGGICQASTNAGNRCTENSDCVALHPGVCNGPQGTSYSGSGPPGSAVIELTLAARVVDIYRGCQTETDSRICVGGDRAGEWCSFDGTCPDGACVPAKGPDGVPCNDDDPLPGSPTTLNCLRGPGGSIASDHRLQVLEDGCTPQVLLPAEIHARFTTGTARAEILDADNNPGATIGADAECSGVSCLTAVSGDGFDCAALAGPTGGTGGAALGAAFATLDTAFGDSVTTIVLGAALCAGDCDDRGSVSVDELSTLVNSALGNGAASACPHGVQSPAEIDVALIIQAVNNALDGCPVPPTPASTATPTISPTPASTATPASTPTPTMVGFCGGAHGTCTPTVTAVPTLTSTITPTPANTFAGPRPTRTPTRPTP